MSAPAENAIPSPSPSPAGEIPALLAKEGLVTADHHIEHWDQGNLLLAMVRLVDQACNKLGVGMRPEPELVLFAIEDAIELTLPGAC
jgi:hypothetical protein